MATAQFLRSTALAVSLVITSLVPPTALAEEERAPLLEEFETPPPESRPRVWWHWMNGNVSEEGIAADIAWMKRIGIGGLQNFDASLNTPQVVKERRVYMTPEWQKAFRFAAEQAESAGLELAIAASPGWSETGGPWVSPEDGIKKVSWSSIEVTGGTQASIFLPRPPETTGPFQTLAEGDGILEQGHLTLPALYRDIAVLAFPAGRPSTEPKFTVSRADGQPGKFDLLGDGDLSNDMDLGTGVVGAPPALLFASERPQEVRSATLFQHDVAALGGVQRFSPVLEAKIGGEWRQVAQFELSHVPTTVAFPPVTASEFRFVFHPYTGPAGPPLGAPQAGVIIPPLLAPLSGPSPVKVAEARLSNQQVIDRYESKAGYSLTNDYFALKNPGLSDELGPKTSEILNLTDRLRGDGSLDWSPPAGRWRIVRMGWTLTGKTNHPAPPEATGLEVDKLDGAAVERYLRHYLDLYREAAGEDMLGERGVRALLTDSTEVGTFNWTPRLVEHFQQLRGYDPTSWLPTLAGFVVQSRLDSDRFLYDFRRTLADLHASQHYGTVARIAEDYGLTLYGEAMEDRRPVLGDDMALRRYADIPMAALWAWDDKAGVRPTLLGDMKGASSVGHFYGKPLIAAESMTSALAPWGHSPAQLRRVIDLAFAHGINRPVIHTSVHQPLDDKQPGLSLMVFGQFFNRHESWADMAKPWIDYISRSSYLLQQGTNVADVAYFYGEEAPITALSAYTPISDTPRQYAYDFVNAAGLVQDLKVDKEGRFLAPSGTTYEALYLGGSSRRLTLPVLRKLEKFAIAGATIVGQRPGSSPSLADDPEEVAAIIDRLWGSARPDSVAKGLVSGTRDIETVLIAKGLQPAFDAGETPAAKDIMFVHRTLPDGELFFVVNRSSSPVKLDARFRVTRKAPQFLDAKSGSAEPAPFRQAEQFTEVPLELRAYDSRFILFREETSAMERVIAKPKWVPSIDLSTGWTVAFEEGRGAQASASIPALRSLSESGDPGIRYFSGEAIYSRSFELPQDVEHVEPIMLDLGEVGDLAEVRINGKLVGTPWEAPFVVSIADAVKPGTNTIEIKVANRWINRLIGDAQPGAKQVAFVTIPTYSADAPLRPSGLIGPVRLLVASE